MRNDRSKIFYYLIAAALGSLCCRSAPTPVNNVDTIKAASKIGPDKVVLSNARPIKVSNDTIINLSNGFVAKINTGDQFEVNNLQLFHRGKRIDLGRRDSTQFTIESKLYPIVNKIDANTFELLFEVPEEPSKNDAMLYRIKNDLLVRKERLPTFITKASDLDGDGVLEYAGAWGYSEEFDDIPI